MKVKEAREILVAMELSPEAMDRAEEILGKYMVDEEIPDEVIDKLLAIVDVEIDETTLAADIYKSGEELADEFLVKVDEEANKISNEIDKTGQNKP